jgi:hypothetical protein
MVNERLLIKSGLAKMLHEISQGVCAENKLITPRHIISIALFVMGVVRYGK